MRLRDRKRDCSYFDLSLWRIYAEFKGCTM
jgi:hypothetical protein